LLIRQPQRLLLTDLRCLPRLEARPVDHTRFECREIDLGDRRLLVLKSGYSFADAKGTEPVYNPSESNGPFAGGGYPYQDNSRMKGQAFFFELEGRGKTGDLGDVDSTQLYPTVCRLLDLKANSAVTAQALDVD
ncbi:MAG: hypothetical protein ABL994_22115, partial [Verrucomicrobiales bacterium]